MKTNIILKRPLVTEKTTKQVQNKVYTFEVDLNANKHHIEKMIKDMYGVEVDAIKTVVRKGKEKKVGRRMTAKRLPDIKIAYITVKKGTIDLFPQS